MLSIETILQKDHRADIESLAIIHENEVYTFYDNGLTRHVFVNVDKTKVIKILIDADSKDFNEEEAEIYENASEEKRKELAKTELVANGMLIEQEYCEPIKFSDKKLSIKQMMFAKSCRDEVGWNSEGELVCFDLDEYKKY